MANTQIQSEQIADDAVTSAKIADNPVFSGNESITIPSGTTAQRPSSPSAGMIRYNTTLGAIEEYDGTQWKNLSATFAATGGTVTTSGIYTYHTFTLSGTFSVTAG